MIQSNVFLYPRLAIRKHAYYIRVSVPKVLIPLVKRKTFFYSLQTKDYFDALYKVREEAYRTSFVRLTGTIRFSSVSIH